MSTAQALMVIPGAVWLVMFSWCLFWHVRALRVFGADRRAAVGHPELESVAANNYLRYILRFAESVIGILLGIVGVAIAVFVPDQRVVVAIHGTGELLRAIDTGVALLFIYGIGFVSGLLSMRDVRFRQELGQRAAGSSP